MKNHVNVTLETYKKLTGSLFFVYFQIKLKENIMGKTDECM